jgi:hypothetical protein
MIKKLWQWFTAEERVFIVSKTYRVVAHSEEEAINMVKAKPALNDDFVDYKAEAETKDYF